MMIRVWYHGCGGQTCLFNTYKDFKDRTLAAKFAKRWRSEIGHYCKHRGVRIEHLNDILPN